MGNSVQFSQAIQALRATITREDDDETFDIREALEVLVLDHLPTTSEEAADIIDVLAWNVETGPRSDQRDLRALANLKAWCLSLAGAARRAKPHAVSLSVIGAAI